MLLYYMALATFGEIVRSDWPRHCRLLLFRNRQIRLRVVGRKKFPKIVFLANSIAVALI